MERSKATFLHRKHTDHQKHKKKCSTFNHQRNANQKYNEVSHDASQKGRHQKNLQKINAGECVEKWDCPYTVGGHGNWYNHCGEQHGLHFKHYKQSYHLTQQSHSWAFIWRKPLLQKDTRTPAFSAALLTIAKARNNLNVHWQRNGTYKQWNISHKKNEIMPLAATATWVDQEMIM